MTTQHETLSLTRISDPDGNTHACRRPDRGCGVAMRTTALILASVLGLSACATSSKGVQSSPPGHEITVGVPVPDLARAVDWYTQVVGRPLETVTPMEGIMELHVAPGSWLQLFQEPADTFEASRTVMRFKTEGIEQDATRLRAKGIEIGEVTHIPGVVLFAEFNDPFGNPVSLYQLDVAN